MAVDITRWALTVNNANRFTIVILLETFKMQKYADVSLHWRWCPIFFTECQLLFAACDCDPLGSLDGGICDSITDIANGLEAGKCHCKTNAEGRRCDTCKNGFWNFDSQNPDGCQSCTCDTLGTIDNQGCNVFTGECTCKRYVTGRDCNQCLPQFWGLSAKHDGCQHCDCDPGGSFDNNCDVITGQCKCRENMGGRRCEIPQQAHFTATLDFLLYEAELARGSPVSFSWEK